jgi:hypothetical protein
MDIFKTNPASIQFTFPHEQDRVAPVPNANEPPKRLIKFTIDWSSTPYDTDWVKIASRAFASYFFEKCAAQGRTVPLPLFNAAERQERMMDLVAREFTNWVCGKKGEWNKTDVQKESSKRGSRHNSRRRSVSARYCVGFPMFTMHHQLYERRSAILMRADAPGAVVKSFAALDHSAMSDDESERDEIGTEPDFYTVNAHASRSTSLSNLVSALDAYASVTNFKRSRSRKPFRTRTRVPDPQPPSPDRVLKPGFPEGTYSSQWLAAGGLPNAKKITEKYNGRKLDRDAIDDFVQALEARTDALRNAAVNAADNMDIDAAA